MTTRTISIASIDAGNRLRTIDPKWVALLAEEIGVNGLSTPVRVVERGDGFKLVDGARRVAAQLQLGCETIEARVEPADALVDDTAVRLGEIKGNMLRADLSALDRAVYIATWCDLFRDASQPLKRGRKPSRPTTDAERDELSATMALNWTEAAQQSLQIGRRSIFRSLKIAEIDATLRSRIALLPVAERQNDLLLLAEESEAKQTAIVDMLTADPARAQTVSEALIILGAAPTAQLAPVYERISERFARLPEKEQHAFFALHESAIDLWLARRGSRQTKAA